MTYTEADLGPDDAVPFLLMEGSGRAQWPDGTPVHVLVCFYRGIQYVESIPILDGETKQQFGDRLMNAANGLVRHVLTAVPASGAGPIVPMRVRTGMAATYRDGAAQ